jgi:hypothetical protein
VLESILSDTNKNCFALTSIELLGIALNRARFFFAFAKNFSSLIIPSIRFKFLGQSDTTLSAVSNKTLEMEKAFRHVALFVIQALKFSYLANNV